MARIEDLLKTIDNAELRSQLEGEVRALKDRKRFGLVFERHVPETVLLPPAAGISVGDTVVLRRGDDERRIVEELSGDTATIRTAGSDDALVLPTSDLVVVHPFTQPIFPTLSETARTGDPQGDARPHLAIRGENFHVLELLLHTHRRKFDVIYIDPPYNTGNNDFVYNDAFVEPDDRYRHSKWLAFMERRLKIARDLLAPAGFIAVSIDDNEMAHLRILMDEIFGEGSIKVIAVKMSEASGMKMSSVKKGGSIPKLKEYVLLAQPGGIRGLTFEPVAKDQWDSKFARVLLNLSREDAAFLADLRSGALGQPPSKADAARADAILKDVDLVPIADAFRRESVAKKAEDAWRVANAWRVVRATGSSSVKALVDVKRESVKQDLIGVVSKRDGIFYVAMATYPKTTTNPDCQILFAADHLTAHPGDIWTDIKTTGLAAEGGVNFKNGKKPLALLRRLIGAHPNPNATVLDFFAGSGSTLHAVAQLNAADGGSRQAIIVTNNEVDPDARKALNSAGHFRGDDAYEAVGIFEKTTWPRCVNALADADTTGEAVALQLEYLNPNRLEIGLDVDRLVNVMWLASGCLNGAVLDTTAAPFLVAEDQGFAILVDDLALPDFIAALDETTSVEDVFICAETEDSFVEVVAAMPDIRTHLVPNEYVRFFRQTAKART